MTHDPELTEAAANVTATMQRLIEDLGAKPITPKRFCYAACELRSMAEYLSQVADAAEAGQRYAEPVESEGGLL